MAGERRSAALVQIIKKIPVFEQLSPNQVQSLLSICVSKTCDADDVLCSHGTPSDEMYVLISGELAIVTPDGTRVATVKPVTTVGEMGLVTRQVRAATVQATKPTKVLVINKSQFENLLRNDPSVQARVYRNIVGILSDRIVNDNVRMRDHLVEQVRFEKRVKEEKRRTGIVLDMLSDQTGIAREEAESRVDEQMVESNAFTVLIVDDEPEVRDFVSRALSQYEVVQASGGTDALEVVKQASPDLVLADIKMPDMDGFALLDKLRESNPGLPVVAISGYAEQIDVDEHDFDGFIQKPVDLESFRLTVEKSLPRD
jgi:CheY-like chemotaxis protein